LIWFCSDSAETIRERKRQVKWSSWRRGRVLRFTPLRREKYLEVLALTGNRRAAAEAIGMRDNRMRAMRARDPALDAECEAALAAANERLGGAEDPFAGIDDPEFSVIRKSRSGRMQVIAVGPGRWSKPIEDRFFAILSHCGNVEAAARAVGFAGTDMFRRKRQWPEFARRWERMLDEAEERLEFRLACWGNNVGPAGESGREESGTVTSDCPSADVVPFDPEFALKFLKWREEKRRGGGRRDHNRVRPPPSIEEVTENIVRKVEAIKRHAARGGGPPEA
jgi:hypothetical protein